MPLMKDKLARRLKNDLDVIGKLAENGHIKNSTDTYKEIGERWSKSIEIYVKEADVVGTHNITNLQTLPGQTVLEWPRQTSPYVSINATVTNGSFAPGSNIGPFGKGSHPGAKGKII